MQSLQADWKERITKVELDFKELQQELTKNRLREAEQYTYDLSQKRKLDNDVFNEKRKIQIAEIAETNAALDLRFNTLKDKEHYVLQLETDIIQVKASVDDVVKKEVGKAVGIANSKADADKNLLLAHNEGILNLKIQKIESLEQHINNQDKTITNLNAQLQDLQKQATAIATKALETSGSRQIVIDNGRDNGKNKD